MCVLVALAQSRVVEALAAASACLFRSAFENKRRYNFLRRIGRSAGDSKFQVPSLTTRKGLRVPPTETRSEIAFHLKNQLVDAGSIGFCWAFACCS